MISDATHDAIKVAVNILDDTPASKRMDGEDWKVYRVGEIIRVDVKSSTTQEA